jgi:hypothetical protein
VNADEVLAPLPAKNAPVLGGVRLRVGPGSVTPTDVVVVAVEVPAAAEVLPALVDVPAETVLTMVPRLPPGDERGVRTMLAPRSFSVARVAR